MDHKYTRPKIQRKINPTTNSEIVKGTKIIMQLLEINSEAVWITAIEIAIEDKENKTTRIEIPPNTYKQIEAIFRFREL